MMAFLPACSVLYRGVINFEGYGKFCFAFRKPADEICMAKLLERRFFSRLSVGLFPRLKLPDLLVLTLVVLVSALLFFQKVYFLGRFYQPDTGQFLFLLLINFAPYLAMSSWAYLLLRNNQSILLRLYVLFVGSGFAFLSRMIERGEESTQQGVDYMLIEHILRVLMGDRGLEAVHIEFFFRYGILLFVFSGLLLKWCLSQKHTQAFPVSVLAVFVVSLVLAFLSPAQNNIPRSISSNGLLYVVKTAWLPVPDIRNQKSNFSFVPHAQLSSSQAQLELESAAGKKTYSGLAEGMNVAIIALESTSANMLDFYPKSEPVGENTTPFLSGLSKNSLIVNEASSVMGSTSKSLVNILCGIEPYLKTEVFEVTLGIPVDCLPQRLKERGYESIFFQSATRFYEDRFRLVEHAGFEKFVSLETLAEEERVGKQAIGPFGLEDNVMLPAHKRWLEGRRSSSEKPFLAFYMTLAQHHPYLPMSHEPSFSKYSDNRYMNDFTNSLSYIDGFIEALVEQYKEAGVYENTLFIFIGDHGEGFGRYHMPWFHNNNMYREGVWVPFMLSSEKLFKEQRFIDGQFSLMDVAPSVEYLLGLGPSKQYRGFPVFEVDESRVVYSACWYKNRCLAIADSQFKYIFNYGDKPDELYRRQGDFREQNNLVEQYPQIAEAYQRELFFWYNDIMSAYETFFSGLDPDYLNNSESYYRFPSKMLRNKEEVFRW
jgi:phosphoglycerol transferase MdoB-like AlkP superfamily enzyme